jgi:hypothetical protein
MNRVFPAEGFRDFRKISTQKRFSPCECEVFDMSHVSGYLPDFLKGKIGAGPVVPVVVETMGARKIAGTGHPENHVDRTL